MIHTSLQTLRWALTLGSKFGRIVPLYTLSIVLLTLVSQISTLLASFLPLKVVILLGSEHVPRYFPDSLQVGRDALIIGLSTTAVGFFILHLAADRLIHWSTPRAARRLLSGSQKMVLFEDQDDIAETGYRRYSRALAGGVFVLLGLLCFFLFYPAMAGVLLGYGVLALGTSLLLFRFHAAFREKLETQTAPTLNLIGGIGFFIAFGYIIADFMLWEPPGFIVALISLLASRLVMLRATGTIADLASLQKQRLKLDALFFHGKALLPEKLREDKTLWPLLRPERRESWIRPVLTELLGHEPGELTISWKQLGIPNVAALHVSDGSCTYLFKLFEHNRSALALHESTLMGEPVQLLPALPWMGATLIGKHQCLVYVLPKGAPSEPRQIRELALSLRTQLFAASPPQRLVHRFQRSKAMIWQRLGEIPWDRLQSVASTSQQQDQVETLLEQLPALRRQLEALPLGIFSPDIQPDALWIPEEGPPVLTNWGRWSLEPIGAGWLDTPQTLPLLAPALAEAAQQRAALAKVLPASVELSALAFALEQECNRQRFVQALELPPLLLERLRLLFPGKGYPGAAHQTWCPHGFDDDAGRGKHRSKSPQSTRD